MSIVLAAATQPSTTGNAGNVVLLILLIVAVGLAAAIRAFSPKSIYGPDRLLLGEPLRPLSSVMIIGFGTWIMATMIGQPQASTTTAPTRLEASHLVVLSAVSAVGALLALIVGNLITRPGGLSKLGLSGEHFMRAIPISLLGILIAMPIVMWIGVLTVKIFDILKFEHPQKHDFLQILDETPNPVIKYLIIFTAIVLAPLFEEMFFRGHLQTLLRYSTRRPWLAVALTSAAFALVHPFWTVAPIFVLSLCLGYAYERTGNLYVPIFIHSLFNAISVLISIYNPG
jgi:membrane protease YdiL (CAAX protease family)